MSSVVPDRIFCSDLQRCRETLQHVLKHQKREPEVTYTSRLQERYMAELQGVSKEEVEHLLKKQNKTKFDFGESPSALTARVEGFWRESVLPLYHTVPSRQQNGHEDTDNVNGNSQRSSNPIFIFSHGGTLLCLTRAILSTFEFTIVSNQSIDKASANTGVTILDTETMTLESYADIKHLDQLGQAEKARESDLEVVDA